MTTMVKTGYYNGHYVTIPNSCLGCGKCCHLNLQVGYNYTHDKKMFANTAIKHMWDGPGMRPYTQNFPKACEYLTEKCTCSIYDERPKCCKECVPGCGPCIAALTNKLIEEHYRGPQSIVESTEQTSPKDNDTPSNNTDESKACT